MERHAKSRLAGDGAASDEELKDKYEYSDPGADGNSFAAYRGRWIERGLSSPDLSDGAFRVLTGIAQFYLNRDLRKAFMAATTLASRLGMAPRTVEKHLAELRTKGFLRSVRRGHGRPNDIFPILDPHECADHEDDEPHGRADHEPHNTADHNNDEPHVYADHNEASEHDPHATAVHEPQERAVKNRKNVRTTPLIEPIEINPSVIETNLYSDITTENKSLRRSAPAESDLFAEGDADLTEASKADNSVEDDFDQFYRTYPKREGRKIALRAYKTARKAADASTILMAAARYAARMDAERREARFIKAPAAWLNGGHFHDEPVQVRQASKTIDADGNSTDGAPDFSTMTMAEREAFAATLSGTDRIDFFCKTGKFACR